jgi:TctA family transporter
MASMFITFFIAIWFIKYATLITRVPIKFWVTPVIALIVWSCVQYTGGWEDYAILILATCLGMSLKYFKISRISFTIGFVLSLKIESMSTQFFTLYKLQDLLHHPISLVLITFAAVVAVYGIFFNNTKINYH